MPEPGAFSEADNEILNAAYGILDIARKHIEIQEINKALDAIWKCVADTNKYFAGQEPWALKKSDPERMGSVLYITAEVIRVVAIMAQPVMPTSCGKLLDLLFVSDDERSFAFASNEHCPAKRQMNCPSRKVCFRVMLRKAKIEK